MLFFGTGLNRPVTGLFAEVIQHLNNSSACITSIDMPSGLYTDSQTPAEGAIIKAHYTISFELPKLAFFLPQHEQFVGEWHIRSDRAEPCVYSCYTFGFSFCYC